jgi:hypothetical protein
MMGTTSLYYSDSQIIGDDNEDSCELHSVFSPVSPFTGCISAKLDTLDAGSLLKLSVVDAKG